MVQIRSRSLAALDEFTKKIVNEGKYHLYKIQDPTSLKAIYALNVGSEILLLDEFGEIIEKRASLQNLQIIDNVYFEDLEFPPSTNSIRACG